jgi:hypothetical protein
VPPALASLALVAVAFATVLTVVGSALAGAALGGVHAVAGAGLGLGLGAVLGLAGMLAGFIALNVAQAVTMYAALDAFEDRPPNLGASLLAVVPRLGDLAVSMLLSFAILFVPLVLSVVLIGVPLVLVAVYFLIYVQAAVVHGREDGLSAVRTSFRIARTHVGETVVLALGAVAAFVVGSAVNGFVVHIPLVNLVAGFAVGGFTSAFVAMATARFYLVLRDTPPAAPYSAPPPQPYAPHPTMLR